MTDTVTRTDWSPSSIESSTPVTVTVCGTFQFDDVKTSRVVSGSASSGRSVVMTISTSVAGAVFSTTVNVSLVPDSATAVPPSDSVTINPSVSSTVETATSCSGRPMKFGSELSRSTDRTSFDVTVPSITASATPVTVTVCGTFQFAGVNVSDETSGTISEPLSLATKMMTSESG